MIRADDLMPYAIDPRRTRGRLSPEPESAHRSPHQRDRDRILHSSAFRKLLHKTQVFVAHQDDYYRTRLTHSLEVAQIARSAARTLRLNEDLAEAVALAHDLGHTPFGHAGERALNRAMAEHGGFDHNAQALRIVTHLERRYAEFDGLNLTWETLEGLVKHNGPLLTDDIGPGDLPFALAEYAARQDLELGTQSSLEAQLAALADDIAYTNHDLEDGLRAGFFELDAFADLPVLGDVIAQVDRIYPVLERRRRRHEVLRRLFAVMVEDMLAETGRRIADLSPATAEAVREHPLPLVGFTPEVGGALMALRARLFERMYFHTRVNRMMRKCERVVIDLFGQMMDDPALLPDDWRKAAETADETGRARYVADYIAGMTDRYALEEHRRIIDPHTLA